MARKWDKKIILSGIVLVLIFIRHIAGTYQDGYGPRLSSGLNQQYHQHQKSIHKHPQPEQLTLSLPHPHRHHHEYMHQSDREMHIKSQHSHFYRDRDYRPATKVFTTTVVPTTLSWKWSSRSVPKLKSPELTHINPEGGNETSVGFTDLFKHKLANGERQQWSANNKQIYIGPYRAKINSDDDEPTSTTKTEHKQRSSWFHNKSRSIQKQDDRNSSQPQDSHRTLLEKTSRSDDNNPNPAKISHEDQQLKSKTDYHDDYDEDYYYEDEDANGQGLSENKIEERRSQKGDNEAAQIADEDKAKGKKELEEYVEVEEAARYRIADKLHGQQMDDDYNSDYVDDEPNPSNEEQNLNISLTEAKWNNYGTAAAVARSRQQYLISPQSKVDAHIHRIKEEGKCRWPHQKVIPLIDASNRFIPHCTILNRCADDTGCCDDDKKTCIAKHKTSVDLYFYVIPIDNHSKPSIESRKFDNHTECHCVDKRQISSLSNRLRRHNVARAPNVLDDTENCQCPRNFRNVLGGRGQCRCDCFKWNQACRDLKEGQDGFSHEDRICISNKKCQKPTCEYGVYSTHNGRCPRLRTALPRSRHNYR